MVRTLAGGSRSWGFLGVSDGRSRVRVNTLYLMQIANDLLITSGGVQFTGERVMEKNDLGAFIAEAATLLSVVMLVAMFMILALDYYAVGAPY